MAKIKDVAKYAGVSIATVSNVINGTKYVSDDLRKKVEQAIEKLDYQVDFIASNMKKKNTNIIGVVVTTLNLIFVPQVINGIQSIASKYDYKLIFYSSDNDFKKEQRYVNMLINSRVDGIIIDSVADFEKNADYLLYLSNLKLGGKRIPVVSIERNLVKFGIHSIHVDNVKGGEIATEHLILHGCKQIALITGPLFSDIICDRITGYERMLQKHNLNQDRELIVKGDYTPLSGYRAVKRLLLNGINFDGIFACNDQMAVGALKALKENNNDVPGDIKIIGFDNTFVSSLINPSLTTVNVPKYRIGTTAVKTLIGILNGKISKDEISIKMPINITVRTSTEFGRDTGWELEYW